MSDLPAKEVYKFIDHFETQQEFSEFVRSYLKIKNRELNDIQMDYAAYGSREQKYQTISLWKRTNGNRATLDELRRLDREFRAQRGEIIEPDEDDSQASISVQGTSEVQSPNMNPIHASLGTSGARLVTSGNQGAPPPQGSMQEVVPGDGSSVINKLSTKFRAVDVSAEAAEEYCSEVINLSVELCTEKDIQDVVQLGDDAYEIKNSPKGYVLIINNNFKGGDERLGAQKDVENMVKLWNNMGCKVTCKQDLTCDDVYKISEKLAKSNSLRFYDYLVIFIMSHGNSVFGNDVFTGSDNQPVYIKDIQSKFNNENCPGLQGKPKLFFFQTCRGITVDQGVVPCDASKKKPEQSHVSKVCVVNKEEVQRDYCPLLPNQCDILVSFATLSGFASYRSEKGSWFINAIANVFAKYARTESIADLMTRVRRAVKEKQGVTEVSTDSGCCKVPCKEMSESRDMLTKKLFLMPGYPRSRDPLED